MTTHMDTTAIEEAKASNRDGGPREDRPEEVDEFLEPEEAVGFEEGLPLLDRPYEEYPDDPLTPDAGADVAALAGHELVGSVEDLAAELDTTEGKVRTALHLHDVEEPTAGSSFDSVEREGVIEVPLHGVIDVEHLRTPVYADARLLEHLYIRCGAGISEIKEILEDGMNAGRGGDKPRWSVTEAEIRSALEDVALISSEDTEGGDSERLRLGGATHDFSESGDTSPSSGLTVSTSDFE
ncbi:hypothetical protein [Halobacterium litoreum]|uniref:Helix-hairpin-helix domain-containing protein n=1 Tax=Halobacterium litoreum TaxID=2039234 RepID=A0ABD5NFK1_9EURY|nr:hypothetical protein [Halobacterium litoreum]UHH13474.1 hypothetical protein LT972_00415 [Halobacterium litoreum]